MDEPGRTGAATLQPRIDRAIIGTLIGQDLSGFEVWRWLGSGEFTAGLFDEADLYPTLYRLEAERLLQSDWHEGERTRRRYRLTSTALQTAQARGWPHLAFRGAGAGSDRQGDAGTSGEPAQTARAFSPDPNAGSWFVPPKAQPEAAAETASLAAGGASQPAGGADGGDASSTSDCADGTDTSSAAPGAGSPGASAIQRFGDELCAALDLPRFELARVRQEIADHLTDSTAALRLGGLDGAAAAGEAIARLGDPHALAIRINRAQQTRSRRSRAIRRAAADFITEILLWLCMAAALIAVSPGLADFVTLLGGLAGLHIVVPRSAEWTTNQLAIMLCGGSFMAGRLSLASLAQISRHSDAGLRRRWAVRGAAVMLVLALLTPGYFDGFAAATILAAPLAFVAGTFRPRQPQTKSYSVRGIAIALALVAALVVMPFARLSLYDPNATPRTPLSPDANQPQLIMFAAGDQTFEYALAGPVGPGTVKVELWPAVRQGLFIVIDPAATGPAVTVAAGVPNSDPTAAPVGAGTVDLAKLPPYRLWWVVVVADGPNGGRTALIVAVQAGASPGLSSSLGWLISKI